MKRQADDRSERLIMATLSLVVGCLSALVILPVWATLSGGEFDLAWDFAPIVWGVASGAWALTVVPLVLWGDHSSWLFRRSLAPLVGAVCGALAVLLFLSAWSLTPPWILLWPPIGWDLLGILLVAAGIGAVIWTLYTIAHARSVRPLD
ncbi:MAG: hypothetical protein R3199_06435 [Gemmatimonadota bacterium]|nr:hypothetical protein [Gemmatimonadota bacterium]